MGSFLHPLQKLNPPFLKLKKLNPTELPSIFFFIKSHVQYKLLFMKHIYTAIKKFIFLFSVVLLFSTEGFAQHLKLPTRLDLHLFPGRNNPSNNKSNPLNNRSVSTNSTSSCSSDSIVLTSQAQIDNFAIDYPTCSNPKYLFIDGTGASPAITNLSGLSSITQVLNKLKISHTSITSLSALTNLTQIGDTLQLEYNSLLTSIGLNNLTFLGGLYFKALPILNSLAGLSNHITNIGNIHLDSTLALSDLSGLSNITRINGSLEILFAPMTNLNSLNNVDSIQGMLYLEMIPL